jgi:hypothetical protein
MAALSERAASLHIGVDAHGLTVAEYLESWLRGKHSLKPSTRAHYRAALDLYLITRT